MASSLSILDLRADLARLPRKPGARVQRTPLTGPASLTFHYSGTFARDRSPAAERRRVTAEATYHLAKNWNETPGAAPIYGSRYQYHYVVFTDGQVGVCNDLVQLWHAGNKTANESSIAVHVLLGVGQRLTPVQRAALFALFDLLRDRYHIPREHVYGHCEWPDTLGPAHPTVAYAPMPGQSRCPEAILHRDLVAYRQTPDAAPTGEAYKAIEKAWVRPSPDTDGDKVAELAAGAPALVQRIIPGELITHARLGTSDEWADIGYGYVWLPQLRKVA